MTSSLIRHDVLPVGVGYLLVMGALGAGLWVIRRHGDAAAAGRRDREAGAAAGTAGPRSGWPRLIRHYLGTAIGGYLLLMAVVILYHYGVTRVGGAFITSAFSGCALLIALATPVFLVASGLAEHRRRSRAARHHPDPPPSQAES
ncbi:MAG: DUF6256 family protein, partial [Streptosporangiaceae bacterium]